MAETTNNNNTEISKSSSPAVKKSFFKGIKAEFGKISWPDKTSLGKQTVAVVIATAVLCVIISVVDLLLRSGLNLII